jgi:hypothetical protein
MTGQKQSSRGIHIALWLVQIILSVSLIWAASLKFFQSIESLAAMWPWAGDIPPVLVRLTGVPDTLVGIGLVLPALWRIKPKLTPIAAVGLILLMVCASIFHMVRAEGAQIMPNIIFAVLAAFVAWGRFLKAPIAPR